MCRLIVPFRKRRNTFWRMNEAFGFGYVQLEIPVLCSSECVKYGAGYVFGVQSIHLGFMAAYNWSLRQRVEINLSINLINIHWLSNMTDGLDV